jgi:hypothetical protein
MSKVVFNSPPSVSPQKEIPAQLNKLDFAICELEKLIEFVAVISNEHIGQVGNANAEPPLCQFAENIRSLTSRIEKINATLETVQF